VLITEVIAKGGHDSSPPRFIGSTTTAAWVSTHPIRPTHQSQSAS